MTSVHWDTREVKELALDLGRVPNRCTRMVVDVGNESAEDLSEAWKRNARETALPHGKHYPKAISWERLGFLTWEIGPNAAMRQGGMSFEYGSRNQPPHLDGSRAADVEAPRYVRRIGIAAEDSFRG